MTTSIRNIAFATATLLTGSAALASDITWNAPQGNTSMINGGNYVGGVAPGVDDTAIYSTDYLAANGNAMTGSKSMQIVNTDYQLKGITFDYGTGGAYAWNILSNGNGSLLLTAGGTILVTGTQTSALTTNIQRPITFAGDYTFDSSTTSGGTGQSNVTFSSAATLTFSSAGPSTLTLKGTAGSVETVTGQVGTSLVNRPGGIINSVIADGGVGAAVSVVKEGAGVWQLGVANTYTGGTTIKQGTIVGGNSAALGTGVVTLGDSATGQNASLLIGSSINIANAITVASGSGLRILGTNAGSNTATFSGAITLSSGSNLRLQVQSSRNLVISGGITGTGNVEVYHNNSVQSGSGIVFNSAINNIGTVTNASPGAGTLTQTGSGVIGANVTEFIQNSATSTTTLNLVNSYDKTSVLAGNLVVASGGTLGTGDVIVNGGLLTLNSDISLSDTAVLRFIESNSATITLNNLSADTVYAVYDMTSGIAIGAGTWTADDLNSFFATSVFTGTGQLTTIAAVPEPSTVALGAVATIVAIAAYRRRHKLA